MLWENLTGKKLLILAGHVNKDSGTIKLDSRGETLYTMESEVNLDISLALLRLLEKHSDATVMLGHGTWGRRAALVDMFTPDLTIEIHCNSYSDFMVRGFEAWTDADEDSVDAADCILAALSDGSTVPAHGKPNGHHWIYQEDNRRRRLFEVIEERPLVLVECGFLSNPDDCAMLVTGGGQSLVATKIGIGINRFFYNDNGKESVGAGGNNQ